MRKYTELLIHMHNMSLHTDGDAFRECVMAFQELINENERLQILLDGRDYFIVENRLWEKFVGEVEQLNRRAETIRWAMGETDED
jgi:hypothetical protein